MNLWTPGYNTPKIFIGVRWAIDGFEIWYIILLFLQFDFSRQFQRFTWLFSWGYTSSIELAFSFDYDLLGEEPTSAFKYSIHGNWPLMLQSHEKWPLQMRKWIGTDHHSIAQDFSYNTYPGVCFSDW